MDDPALCDEPDYDLKIFQDAKRLDQQPGPQAADRRKHKLLEKAPFFLADAANVKEAADVAVKRFVVSVVVLVNRDARDSFFVRGCQGVQHFLEVHAAVSHRFRPELQ